MFELKSTKLVSFCFPPDHSMSCFVFQSVVVTLLAVALAMYLTRKSLKQGTSPPAAAPPAPSTPAPAKQPEEVKDFIPMDLQLGLELILLFPRVLKTLMSQTNSISTHEFRLVAPTSGPRTRVRYTEAQFSGVKLNLLLNSNFQEIDESNTTCFEAIFDR